ncbi:MAG: alpha/beta hydrolase [Gammaproteobacteria bacterium]|nr:alpha/beta hydrolase [Gammaproteobacteria bacterium]
MKNSKHKKTSARIPLALRLLRFIYNTFGRVFPVYFGHRAYDLWFTTTRFKMPEREKHAFESAIKENIEVNKISISVYIWQHESIEPIRTLLYVHGWTGRGTQIAPYLEQLHAIGYRVISFDGPAHGSTPGTQTSILEMTDMLFALNKTYGDFDAAITHSFGGMALTYAMSRGLKIKNVALISPPNNFQNLINAFQQAIQIPDSVMLAMERKGFATHGQVTRDLLDMKNNVKQLSNQGLIIHDEDDIEFPCHDSEATAKVWPGAKFIKTKGLGHRRIIRDEYVIRETIRFLGSDID